MSHNITINKFSPPLKNPHCSPMSLGSLGYFLKTGDPATFICPRDGKMISRLTTDST